MDGIFGRCGRTLAVFIATGQNVLWLGYKNVSVSIADESSLGGIEPYERKPDTRSEGEIDYGESPFYRRIDNIAAVLYRRSVGCYSRQPADQTNRVRPSKEAINTRKPGIFTNQTAGIAG